MGDWDCYSMRQIEQREGWRECKWGDIATLEYGKGLRDYRHTDGTYPVYGTNGPIGTHTESLSPRPGVIIGRKGAYRGVHYSPQPFFVIDTAFYLKPKIDIDLRWAYYELLTHDINGMDSGSAIPSTSRDAFYNLPVKVPPIIEQRAIAAILGALDDKIELNRRMNTTLEAMARAIFTSWFVDFDPVRAKMEGRLPSGMDADTAALFPDAFEDSSLGRIPQGWANVHFAALADLSRISLNPANFAQEVFDHYSIPAYDNGQVPVQHKGESILSNKFLVPENCVLLSKLNPRFPRVWLPNQDSRRRAIASTEFLVLLPKLPVSREFLYSLCSSQDFAERFATSVTGTSGSHQRVRPDDLLAMNVALAPESVLRAFTRLSDPLLHQIQVNQQESLTLGAARDALLPKLLSGEIRVEQAETGMVR